MPELPEVETVARLVRPHLEGRRIEGTEVEWVRTLGGMDPADFDDALRGRKIRSVGRRAKWILIDLDPSGHLLIHLRMSGRLHVEDRKLDPGPWRRVSLQLDSGRDLHFVDVRKFGRVLFTEDPAEHFDKLGPEPLGDEFTEGWFWRELRARKRVLKPLLLDQSFLAGLGNIYVDESLHQARIHPSRRSDQVTKKAAERLHSAIRSTLERAILHEGSSFDPFYRTPEGQPGSYQEQFLVYGRQGKPCRRCGAALRKMVLGGRGTHFCGRCQRAPRSRPAS